MTATLSIVPPAAAPLPPQLADVVVLDHEGTLWVPNPEASGDVGWHLHTGARVRWMTEEPRRYAIVQLLGGEVRTAEDARRWQDEGFVAVFDRPALRGLIAQLQAIDAQLVDLSVDRR